jgi:hypothetical protein
MGAGANRCAIIAGRPFWPYLERDGGSAIATHFDADILRDSK